MQVELNGKKINLDVISVDEITPYENNVKVHPESQLQGLSKSIEQFGFKQPIVIDKNKVIIAGHARYEAAVSLGYKELLCVLADDLTDDEINAYRLLDNEIASQGTIDFQALEAELAKMPDFDFSLFNTDFKGLLNKKIEFDEPKENITDTTQFIVSVFCIDESEQQKVYEDMQAKGYTCKLIM